MKYILAILTLSSLAFGDVHRSFRMNIQQDGHFAKTGGTSWANAARIGTATRWVATGVDTIWSGKPAATWENSRWLALTDTINPVGLENDYVDSLVYTVGDTMRIDSIALFVRVTRAIDACGCNCKLFASVSDTCYDGAYGHIPTSTINQLNYAAFTTGANGVPDRFDSVAIDTTVFGVGDTAWVSFTITTPSILDEIWCRMRLTGSSLPRALGFWIATCFDADNVDPVSGNPKAGVSILSIETTGADSDPYVMYYVTKVEPSAVAGIRSKVSSVKEIMSQIR